MGSTCSAEQAKVAEQESEVAEVVTEKAEQLAEQAKEIAEDVKEKAGELAEEAKEIAEDVQDKVEEAAAQVQEAVAPAEDGIADAAAHEQAEVEEKVEAIQERAAEVVADVKEAVADTMTAAVASMTDTVIVEFTDSKGASQTVTFTTKDLGFTCSKPGAGCCTSAPKGKVVVGQVQKNKQADKLGVKRGWGVQAVSGTRVNGPEEANKLLLDGSGKLPEKLPEA